MANPGTSLVNVVVNPLNKKLGLTISFNVKV